MHLIMFDIDGTLVKSYDFDSACFQSAIYDVLGIEVEPDWGQYQHVTDAGILREIIEGLSLQAESQSIVNDVKEQFVSRVKKYISDHEVLPITGANEFLSHLALREDVVVSLATGGWSETASLKLNAAGINSVAYPMASSCDHYNRIDIMRIAEGLTGPHRFTSKTYFGDGPWDLKASEALGYDFVAVGDRIKHPQSIFNYSDVQAVLSWIGI